MCAHLLKEHDVKNITFFAGTKESYDSKLRLDAVRDCLKENHCEDYLKEVFYTNWENAVVENHINKLCMAGEKLPDLQIRQKTPGCFYMCQ